MVCLNQCVPLYSVTEKKFWLDNSGAPKHKGIGLFVGQFIFQFWSFGGICGGKISQNMPSQAGGLDPIVSYFLPPL